MNELQRQSAPLPIGKAWTAYILVYLVLAIPVRLLATWLATTVWVAEGQRTEWRAQVLAGIVLLPASYLCYKWSVRRIVLSGSRGDRG